MLNSPHKLCDLLASPSTVLIVKSRMLQIVGHVVHMKETKTILFG